MTAHSIIVPRAFPWIGVLGLVAFTVTAALISNLQVESTGLRWTAFGVVTGLWVVFLLIERRPSSLSMDADGLLLHRHRIGWDEITSIEPPSARGEIVLRLNRAVPKHLLLGPDSNQDWAILEGTSYATGPAGLYALLVGTSHEASWLLASADNELTG